jgi:hypothetical protein
VFYAMAIFMPAAAILAIADLRGARQQDPGEAAQPGGGGHAPGEDTTTTVGPDR